MGIEEGEKMEMEMEMEAVVVVVVGAGGDCSGRAEDVVTCGFVITAGVGLVLFPEPKRKCSNLEIQTDRFSTNLCEYQQ